MRTRLIWILTAGALILGGRQAAQADTVDEQIDAIMARIRQRAPKLLAKVDAGVIGETYRGTVETVKPTSDKDVNDLVAEENADREQLFKLLAKKRDLSVAEVRKNFAVFRYRKAADKHYFKGKNGDWLTKAEWEKKGTLAPFK